MSQRRSAGPSERPKMSGTAGFLRHFLAAYPIKTAVMVALLVFSGLAEGLGVATLLPVLEFAEGQARPESDIALMVVRAIEAIGLSATLGPLLALIVVAMTVKAALLWIAMRTVGFVTADVTADLRLGLLRGLLNARWQYFAGQTKGELVNAMSTEAQRASGAFREACSMFANVALIAVYAAVSFLMSWQATLIAIFAGALFFIVFNQFVVMSRRAGRRQTQLLKSLSTRFVDVIGGLKAVKAMGLERLVFPILESEVDRFRNAQKEQIVASEGLKAVREPTLALFLAIAIFALVQLGEPISKVLVLAFIGYRLLGIISNVQKLLQSVVVGESAFWSFRELMDRIESESADYQGSDEPPRLSEEIRFEDVSFDYGEGPVLQGLDLQIPHGSFISLVGESGAGKTTIADLILGLIRPRRGRILVDGVPLDDLDIDEWRKQLGYVPQDPLLLHDTVRHNITLGDDDITESRIIRSLQAAGAWNFVHERPQGLDSVVGEHGTMLSGGQRQRIAIARALVRNPTLLILDEPTTALDPATEKAICDTLISLRGKMTMLSISHQEAMQDVSDIVYELVDGKLRAKTRVRA